MDDFAAAAVLQRLVELFALPQLARATVYAVAVSLALFAIIYSLEWWQGADRSRYASRSFLNDMAYALFYQGQFYSVFIFSAVASALDRTLGILKLDLILLLPPAAAYVCWWLTLDFLGYWVHRLQHRSRILWAFHSVHHAPERLTFLTSYRVHVVEQLTTNVALYVPLLLLGLPPRAWIGVVFAQAFFEAIQHSELEWRFGRLHRFLVSPVFHAFHHSADRRHYDRNFGKILSVWDFVFGTAVASQPRPRLFGVNGLRIPESIVQQFLTPFRLLRPARQEQTSTTAPLV
jgi:sterol desaturase/sphingolipid hydroxylase (fatty acid hydroxylase superfamily)